MQPFAPPEILSSDLTPLVMELAAWGVDTPVDLPFLTQPRPADFESAQALLKQLGALDENGRITDLGSAHRARTHTSTIGQSFVGPPRVMQMWWPH